MMESVVVAGWFLLILPVTLGISQERGSYIGRFRVGRRIQRRISHMPCEGSGWSPTGQGRSGSAQPSAGQASPSLRLM